VLVCVCSGIFAALAVGLIFCAEHLRDTLFIRPHPAVWRFVTGIGLFYTMFCTYLLFQSATDIRTKILPQLDSGVTGEPPAHRSYGESCELTWPNVKVRGASGRRSRVLPNCRAAAGGAAVNTSAAGRFQRQSCGMFCVSPQASHAPGAVTCRLRHA